MRVPNPPLVRAALVAGVFAFMGATLAATPAHAWQCNRVRDNSNQPTGSALYWPTRRISYAFNGQGTRQMPSDQAFNAIREAFNTWQSSALRPDQPPGCAALLADPNATSTDVVFEEQPMTDQNYAGYSVLNPGSNRNVIMFRDDAWNYPLIGDQTADYMSMTTVTFNKLSGQILDADIEFNSFGYRFTNSDSNAIWDLQNVAAHEVGHFLGFGHSVDGNATMFSTALFGETNKRLLHCDDAVGLWFRFPTGTSTKSCSGGVIDDTCGQCAPPAPLALSPQAQVRRTYDGHGGCQCQSAAPGQAAGAAALVLLWRRWRRRQKAA